MMVMQLGGPREKEKGLGLAKIIRVIKVYLSTKYFLSIKLLLAVAAALLAKGKSPDYWAEYIAPSSSVRIHLWVGKAPPPDPLSEWPSWERREGTCVKNLG